MTADQAKAADQAQVKFRGTPEGAWLKVDYYDKPVVYFTPVIMVPKGNPKNVRTVQDMARPGVRVALGHPEALAVGPLTKRILKRAGVWEKIRPNVVMEAGCIPELTNAVVVKDVPQEVTHARARVFLLGVIRLVPRRNTAASSSLNAGKSNL